MKTVAIERTSARDRQALADLFESGLRQPIIVTDAIADWPAKDKWTFDYFASTHGHQVGIAPLEFGARPVVGKATLLGAFIQHLDKPSADLPGVWVGTDRNSPGLADATFWSFAWEPFKNEPGLLDDVSPFPDAVPNLGAGLPRDIYEALEALHGRQQHAIYISRKDTVTPFHRDWHHTFGCLVQFSGDKSIVALEPASGGTDGLAEFSPLMPDYERFPAMRDRTAYTAVLQPSEMLIIPPDWPHYTRSHDHSITLSHSFFNAANIGAFMEGLRGDAAQSPEKAALFGKISEFFGIDA